MAVPRLKSDGAASKKDSEGIWQERNQQRQCYGKAWL